MTEVLTREKKAAWTAWRSAYKSGTGRKILRQTGRILLGAAPGFTLAFSDICGVSAGAWAAYGMAAASCGQVTYPVSLGIAAAFLMRMLWGLTTRWELLIGAVLVLLSPHVLRQRNGAFPLIATGLALLPGAISGGVAGVGGDAALWHRHHSAGNALRAGYAPRDREHPRRKKFRDA